MFCKPCCDDDGSSSGSTVNHDRALMITSAEDDGDDWLDEIWFDALEGDDEEEPIVEDNNKESVFEVSQEELAILRDDLRLKFPMDYNYMSDAYLLSVASKPYSKDMSIRRPLEYTMGKMQKVMEWRKSYGAPELMELLNVANNSSNSDDVDKETIQSAKALATSFNTASWYWHGLTKEGHPILWVRTNRKPWYPNVTAELNSLVLMVDTGIRYGMPEGVTSFAVISHSDNPPPPNPKFAYGMLNALVKGYPDRLSFLISAPTSSIVEFCMNLLLPLMPGRLTKKFRFLSESVVKDTLAKVLWHGEEDIPTFFGGSCVDHDVYYPKNGVKNGGHLTFDFYGMKKRLEEQMKLYEEQQQQRIIR